MKKKIILGIPQVPSGKIYHPGGQLTAANGLVEFLKNRQIKFVVLNTVATVYPPVPIWKKILQSIARISKASYFAARADTLGYMSFSGFGLSLYERCAIALVYRIFRKTAIIFFRSSEILGEPMSKYKRLYLSVVLSFPSSVVSQGVMLANELRLLGCRAVVVIPNWVLPDYPIATMPKLYPADGVITFVFVGWLEKSKGIPELIEAVSILSPIANRFRLLLIGSGSMEVAVADSVAKLTHQNVEVMGWIEQSKVAGLLRQSHVFILPSHSEGFPNALLEAMANGLPAIVTRVGAIPDSIEHEVNGIFVEINDPVAIASAMERYIDDHELLALHSKRCIELVKSNHNYATNCSKLTDLLRH
jgi:glycosyltransferase involved in cell wall biosynthesis